MFNKHNNIVTRLMRQDADAADAFVRNFGPRLMRAASRLGLSGADAEELVADTLSEALLSIRSYRGASTLFTWVYGIFLNLLRTRRRRSREIPTNNIPEQPLPKGDDFAAKKLSEILPLAIAELPEIHRQVIMLKYMDGLSVANIALRTGMAAGTVKSRLHNARLAIRKFFNSMNLLDT